jgi:hypothetical protein
MSDRFLIWDSNYVEGFCALNEPEGFDGYRLLMDGVRVSDKWPTTVVLRMDPDHPKDIKLADNVHAGGNLIVSSRLKGELASLVGSSSVEFLPISIMNHKGRVASKDYFLVNPVDTIDCIDTKASEVKWNKINPNMISRCKKLVLDEKSIPASATMFRPKFWSYLILIKRSVAASLVECAMTGLSFIEPANYIG